MNKNYFGYIRVSTVRQGERGSSLTEQKSAIVAYAARHELSLSGWFEDRETAAKQGRREFSRMLAGLKAGKAVGLIIHKIDRSARNLRDWADLGDLIDRGVDVRFVSDNFDMTSRGGRLSADIQAVVAADYIRNLREEVKKGIYGRLKQGIYPFAAPVGYLNPGKGKAKVIDPVKGPLVRYLFERYASNTIGFEELRHELVERGLRSPSGKPLYPNTLTHILNNPFYMGVIRLGSTGETFPGAHDPLITKALYDRVQHILRGRTVPKAKKHHFLLRQMVKCENCGRRTLTGERQKGFVYYRCHAESCRGVSWRGDTLEGVVLAHFSRIRFGGHGDVGDVGEDREADEDLKDLRDLVANECRDFESDAARLKTSLLLRLQHLDDRTTRLTDLLVDGAIDQVTHNARREKLLMERQGILNDMEGVNSRSPLLELFEEFERNNRELLRYEMLLDDEKREIINIVCSNFSVNGEKSVFTLRTPYKEIAESQDFSKCPHHRDDVRTRDVFAILKSIADEQVNGAGKDDIAAAKSPTSPRPPASRRHPPETGADLQQSP
jgi:site-specific DNA recombinase